MAKEKASAILPENYQSLNEQRIAKNNERFCKFAYIVGSFFCAVPWYDFKKHALKRPLLYKVYSLVYGLCLGALLVVSSLQKDYMVRVGTFDKILETCSEVISILLTEYLIFSSIFLNSEEYVSYVRDCCTHLAHMNCEYDSVTLFYVQFVLGHLFCFATLFYTFFTWSQFVGMSYFSLHFVSMAVSEYYCFLATLIASHHALIIKGKYNFINKLLVQKMQCRPGISEKQVVEDLLEIGKHYRTNGQLVDWFNRVFGCIIIFIFWHALVELLRCPNLVLIIRHDPEIFWSLFVSILLGALLSLGECIYLIWCCASATSAGMKTAQLCNKLQENLEPESEARNEMFKLAYVVKTYEPKFTAADFFVINKGTILGLINITTTYLIVIVQFNGALKEISK